GGGRLACQDLVDPATVEVDNLEAPAGNVHMLAGSRQVLEMRQQEAGQGRVVAPFRYQNAEMVRHLVRRHRSGQQPGTVVALDDLELAFLDIGAEDARNRLKDIRRR